MMEDMNDFNCANALSCVAALSSSDALNNNVYSASIKYDINFLKKWFYEITSFN